MIEIRRAIESYIRNILNFTKIVVEKHNMH